MANLTPGDLGSNLTRQDFPEYFMFGAATSAYQGITRKHAFFKEKFLVESSNIEYFNHWKIPTAEIIDWNIRRKVEGAYEENRKGISIWDTWTLLRPAKVSDGANGCVAIDHYNRIKGDIKLMKKLGIDHYRFSIAWPRILPGGNLSTGVNREGVRFYNELIDLLLAEGIQPLATMFHFDLPQSLEDEYSGFLDRRIVKDFAAYADVCFFEFGDRVKLWATINEAHTYANSGYIIGSFPPGHGSPFEELGSSNVVPHRCASGVDQTLYGKGKAATEPYLVAHNLILAHAAAVDVYRTKYKAVQGGKIGMANVTSWFDPYSELQEDRDAAQRAIDFVWGWFVEPIVTGHYPESMQEQIGDRLPKFTPEEEKLVTGSFDFLGMNYYTTNWAAYNAKQPGDPTNYNTDQEVRLFTVRDGVPIGPRAGSDWVFIVPRGIYQLLTYTKEKYNDPVIFITENGVSEKNIRKLPLALLLEDDFRIKYHEEHLAYVKQAMDKGVKVIGYTVWALFDNFEWAAGYTVRFGMYYVDYFNNYTRYPKSSAKWYMNFLNKKNMPLASKARQLEEVKEDKATKRKRNN